MTKKSKKTDKGDTWEWEETPEMRAAVERLHKTMRTMKDFDDTVSKLEAEAPDYGVGK